MSGDARKWLVTFGGAGLLPGAPGTAGSLAAALLIYLATLATRDAMSLNLILLCGMLVASFSCVALGRFATEQFGEKDPGPMVLDEVAGVCLTMLFQPIAPGARIFWTIGAAFVMFRIFDVTKPPPCRSLEQLPLGWGILMDDLMAGVYANVACQVL